MIRRNRRVADTIWALLILGTVPPAFGQAKPVEV